MIHPTTINGVKVFKDTATEFYFKQNPASVDGSRPAPFLLRDGELIPVDAHWSGNPLADVMARNAKIIGPGKHRKRGRRRGKG